MNATEFTAAACALLGSAVGWQSAMAQRLGVNRRTLARWLQADATPEWVDRRIVQMMGDPDRALWPRDEWMTGDTVDDAGRIREYVVHLQEPRFFARIVALDDDGSPMPAELPADVVSGIVYASDDYVLCEIAWIDNVPTGQITQLLDAACDHIDEAAT